MVTYKLMKTEYFIDGTVPSVYTSQVFEITRWHVKWPEALGAKAWSPGRCQLEVAEAQV